MSNSDNSEKSEYQFVYPYLDSDDDSRIDQFNELEELFNAVTAKHISYIEATHKNQVGDQIDKTNQLGEELITIEEALRAKLKELTRSQFIEQDNELNKKYTNSIENINIFINTSLKKSNIPTDSKNNFTTSISDLINTVQELNTFREQKVLPDLFRILRATASEVGSKISIRLLKLQTELQTERSNFDIKFKRGTDALRANLEAAKEINIGLKKEIEEFEREITNLSNQNTDLSAQLTKYKTEVDHLKADLSISQQEQDEFNSSLLDKTQTFDRNAEKFKEERRRLETSIREKDSLLESTRLNESQLKTKLEQTTRHLSSQIRENKLGYENELTVLKNTKSELTKQLDEYKQLYSLLNKQYQINHEELVSLHKILEEKQQELNDHYFNSVTDLKETLTDIQQGLATSSQLTKETVEKLKDLNKENLTEENIEENLRHNLFNDLEYEESDEDLNPYRLTYISGAKRKTQRINKRDQVLELEKSVIGLNQRLEESKNKAERLQRFLTKKTVNLNECRAQLNQLTQNIAQEQPEIVIENMDGAALTRNLGELFSREEKKSIPYFNGQSDGKLIHDWLKFAERVAINNNWDDVQKVRFFSDRLTGEPLEWHNEFLNHLPYNPNIIDENEQPPIANQRYTLANLPYELWKTEFIARFTNIGQLEKLRNKLNLLRQNSDQDVQSFISQINNLYSIVNGVVPRLPNNATQRERELGEANEKLRNQDKLKILLKGLLPEVKNEIWNRMPANPTYEFACKAALDAETVVINKQINEDKGLTAVVAGMSVHEEEQDKEIKKQKAELELLKHQFNILTLSNNISQGMDSSPKPLIAAVSEERPASRLRFERSPSTARSEERRNEERRSRSSSPYPNRPDRSSRERFPTERYLSRQTFNNSTGNNFHNQRRDWNNRSRSGSRNQSVERGNYQYRSLNRRPFYQSNRNQFNNRQEYQQRNFNKQNFNSRNIQFNNSRNNYRPNPVVSSSNNTKVQTCYYCHKPGHVISQCREKQRKEELRNRMNFN